MIVDRQLVSKAEVAPNPWQITCFLCAGIDRWKGTMKFAFLLLPGLAFAQINEKITVIHKDIRVHVLDRNDEPVKGLTLNDFVLEENGKAQTVDYFEEVDNEPQFYMPDELYVAPEPNEADAQPEPGKQYRYKILFVESSQMTPGNFTDVKAAIYRFIDQQALEDELIKIVHMDYKFNHVTGFTRNKNILKEAMGKMEFQGRLRRDLMRVQSRINDAIVDWDLAPDRERGGYELGVNAFVREKARLKSDYYKSFYYNMFSLGNMLEYIRGPKTIYLLTSGSYLEVDSEYGGTVDFSEKLGRILNRADATIYTLLFKPTSPIGGAFSNLNLRNQPPNFAGMLVRYGEFPPDQFTTKVISNTIVEDNRQLETGPSDAAAQTGGLFVKSFGTSEIDKGIHKLEKVANHYYRLGYALKNPDKKVAVSIKLKDKESGWQLLYGKEFEPSSNYLKLPKDERDIAFKSMLLYSQSYRNDLDADWTDHVFARSEGGFRIPIIGRFSVKEPPKEGFEFGMVALDEHRDFLDMTSAILTAVPASGQIQFYDLLVTDQKPRYVRSSIRNLDNGDLSFHELEIRPEQVAAAKGPRLSEVLINSPDVSQALAINHIRFLNSNDSPKKQDEGQDVSKAETRHVEDPFKIEDQYFKPTVEPYRFKGGPLWFMFHLENPGGAGFQVQFLVKSGQEVREVPGRIVKTWREPGGTVHYQGELNASMLAAGDYSLWIRAVDTAANQAYFTKGDFAITEP